MTTDRAALVGHKYFILLGQRFAYAREKISDIKTNLRLAFPAKSKEEIDRLGLSVWANMGEVAAEYTKLGQIGQGDRDLQLEVVTKWNVDKWRRKDKPAIFVTAHLANWELAAAGGVALDIPLAVVYHPMDNPILDYLLRRCRSALGCQLVSRAQGFTGIMGILNRNISVGFITDTPDRKGENIPYCGASVPTTLFPARLALKFDYDFVPVRMERLSHAHYRVTFHKPITSKLHTDCVREKSRDMMCQANKLFEIWIHERPDQWACLHRIWPSHMYAGSD